MVRSLVLALLVVACARDVAGNKPAPLDTSCAEDSDCVPAPGCCPAPCTEQVINVRELPRARDALRCDPKEVCPQAGGCPTFSYRCVSQQCKLVFAP